MKLLFKENYRFAHGGTDIEDFQPGQIVESPSERLYKVAIEDGKAVDPDQKDLVQPPKEAKPKKKA